VNTWSQIRGSKQETVARPGPRHKNTGPDGGRGRFRGTPKYPQISVFLLNTTVAFYFGSDGWKEFLQTTGDDAEVLLGLVIIEPEIKALLDVVFVPASDALEKPDPCRLVRVVEV
jgi:hypothetical protein